MSATRRSLAALGFAVFSFVGTAYAQVMPDITTPCPINLGRGHAGYGWGYGPVGFKWLVPNKEATFNPDHTFVCIGQPMSDVQGQFNQALHLYMITGNTPGTSAEIGPLPIGGLSHIFNDPGWGGPVPVCIAQEAWTIEYYDAGFPVPQWPVHTKVRVSDYEDYVETVTLQFFVDEPLQPNANYSISLICAIKQR